MRLRETTAAETTTALPSPPSARPDLGGPLVENECEGGWPLPSGWGTFPNSDSHPPPPRTPVSPFRLRKKSE